MNESSGGEPEHGAHAAAEPEAAAAPSPTVERPPATVDPAPAAAASQPTHYDRKWLWDHAGRLAAGVLGLIAVAFLVLLAVAGYSAAGILLALVIGGLAMIIIGGRIRSR